MVINIDDIPDIVRIFLQPDETVVKELKHMKTPGGQTIRKVIDYAERGLNVPPVSGRRGGESRLWLPSTASDHDASARLVSRLPRNEVAEIRSLALILYATAGDARELIRHEPEFRGKPQYEPFILYWLRVYCANVRMRWIKLLDHRRLEYFINDKSLEILLWGLTHGFYEGWTVDTAGKAIRPKDRELPDPELSINTFASALIDPYALIFSGKPPHEGILMPDQNDHPTGIKDDC
jgi:hypothetical protein